jgi:hypothetical protein
MSSTIYVSNDELLKVINDFVKDDTHNRDDIVNCILSIVLAGYSNPEILVKATLGLIEEPVFTVGDTVYIEMQNLYLGSIDIPASKAEGFVIDKYIKGVVTKINKFSSNPYHVDVVTVAADGKSETRAVVVSDAKLHDKLFIPAPGRLNVGDIL